MNTWKEVNGSTKTVFQEIPKEQYDRLSAMSYANASDAVISSMNQSYLNGYGYYGFRLRKKDGRCYLGVTTGLFCD